MMHIYLAIQLPLHIENNDLLPTSLAQTINFKSTFPGPYGNISSQHET